ncbi:MAG: PQQ-binding-like beta-propeller repeat protein [candidate division WOR-3 bacterium]
MKLINIMAFFPKMITSSFLLLLIFSCKKKLPEIPPTINSPTLISPANGSVMRDNAPFFDWSDVTGAVAYEIKVSSGMYNFSESTGVSEYQPDRLRRDRNPYWPLQDGSYHWCVRARDSIGNWSDWSDEWQFTVATIKWFYSSPDPTRSWAVCGPTLGLDGSIYAVFHPIYSQSYLLVALNPQGVEKWRLFLHNDTNTAIGVSCSYPIVGLDGTIYVSYNDQPGYEYSTLAAISPGGTIKWILPSGSPPYYDAEVKAIAEDGSLICGGFTRFFCVDTNSSIKWIKPYGVKQVAIGSNGNIFAISSGSGGVNALLAFNSNGDLIWSKNIELYGISIAPNGTVVGVGSNLYAIDPNSGSILWQQPYYGYSRAIISDDNIIYVKCGDGLLHAFNIDGTLRWISDSLVSGGGPPPLLISRNGPIIAEGFDEYGGANGFCTYKLSLNGDIIQTYFLYYVADFIVAPDGTIYAGGVNRGPYAGGVCAIYGENIPDIQNGWPMREHDAQRTNRAR